MIPTQHKNDHRWLQRALEGEAGYVALIASQHRAQLVLGYLAAEGVPADRIAKIFAPAGLDLAAVTLAEIALSIVSQIAAQRGGTSRPLNLKEANLDRQPGRASDKLITQCDARTED